MSLGLDVNTVRACMKRLMEYMNPGKKDQGIKRSTDVGINYRLCHANVWNKDKNESKVIDTFTKNNDILVSRGGFDNFYS